MALRHRLKRLEGGAPKGSCPECGQHSIHDTSVEHEIEVTWYDDPDNQPTDEPTICPACGQPDFIVVTWKDLDDELQDRATSKTPRAKLRSR